MRVPVVSNKGKSLMPTTSARCRKMLRDGVAEKHWSKEGIFYIQMLVPTGKEIQEVCLAIDPGSKFDGYCVSGISEVCLQGMAILPKLVRRRMETRSTLRRNRRYRNCRRRKARFNNRRKKNGWIAPSQLAKVHLRARLIKRLCQLFPISDIAIEDVKFNHYKKRWGKYFSTVEIGKTRVYDIARDLATLWLPRGWETAQARKDYGIEKCGQKSRLVPESHANDAWAMCCWLFGEKPENTAVDLYVWRRREWSKRQLHRQNFGKGGKRTRYGGTTHTESDLRKGDIVFHRNKTVGCVGGWSRNGKVISLIDSSGKYFKQAGAGTINLLARSSNILNVKNNSLPPH